MSSRPKGRGDNVQGGGLAKGEKTRTSGWNMEEKVKFFESFEICQHREAEKARSSSFQLAVCSGMKQNLSLGTFETRLIQKNKPHNRRQNTSIMWLWCMEFIRYFPGCIHFMTLKIYISESERDNGVSPFYPLYSYLAFLLLFEGVLCSCG